MAALAAVEHGVKTMNTQKNDNPLPETVDEAVQEIVDDMPLDERVKIARMSESELAPLKLALRAYVQSQLEQSGINEKLKASCCEVAGKDLDEVPEKKLIYTEA